jgi:hypothetical protein
MPPFRIGGLPAADLIPVAAVAKAIRELQKLGANKRDALAAFGPIHGHKADQAARAADADLLKAAAAKGGDLSKIGSPNADKLQSDRKAYDETKRGYDAALDEKAREVAELIDKHADELAAGNEEIADEAAADYAAVVRELRAARAALVTAVTVRHFLAERAYLAAREEDPLTPRPRTYQTTFLSKGVTPIDAGKAIAGMEHEADTCMRVEQPEPHKVPGPSGWGYTPHRSHDERLARGHIR